MVAVDSVDTHSYEIPDDAHMLCVPGDAIAVETMK